MNTQTLTLRISLNIYHREKCSEKTVQKYVTRILCPIQFLRKSYGFRTFIFNSHHGLQNTNAVLGAGEQNMVFIDFRLRSIIFVYYNTNFKHIQKCYVLFGLNNNNKH